MKKIFMISLLLCSCFQALATSNLEKADFELNPNAIVVTADTPSEPQENTSFVSEILAAKHRLNQPNKIDGYNARRGEGLPYSISKLPLQKDD